LVTVDKRLYNKEYKTMYGKEFNDHPLDLNDSNDALDVFLMSQIIEVEI
jgi:hypothetical protein